MNTSLLLRYFLYLLSFIEGYCVLAIQIGGTRVLAPAFGTSIFVWTSQISITLVTLAIGYIVAGKLTERFGPLKMLSITLTATTGWLIALPFLKGFILTPLLSLDSRLGVLVGAGSLFGLPLLLLGGTGPIIIKALVETVHESGKIAGRIFGISTLGSVAGAMYLGFVGLGIHSTNEIIWGLGGMIGLCSIITLSFARYPIPVLFLLLPLSAFLLPERSGKQDSWKILYSQPSPYGGLMVADISKGENILRCLFQDGVQQDCNLEKPKTEHMAGLFHSNQMAILAETFGTSNAETLVVGSAGGLLAMYFTRRESRVDIIEINPAMIPLARTYFNFDPSRIRTLVIEDARTALRKLDTSYDLILFNTFIGDSFPAHLVTREALMEIFKKLKPGGIVVSNLVGDLGSSSGRKSFEALYGTYRSVFEFNRFYSTPSVKIRPANIFVISSKIRLKNPSRSEPLPYIKATPFDTEALSYQIPPPSNPNILLTDNFNPIEHLDASTRQKLRKRLLQNFHDPFFFIF